jgi:hypothetical protein
MVVHLKYWLHDTAVAVRKGGGVGVEQAKQKGAICVITYPFDIAFHIFWPVKSSPIKIMQ